MSMVVLGTWGSAPSGLGSGVAAAPENPWRGGWRGRAHPLCVGQLAETTPPTLLPPSPRPGGLFLPSWAWGLPAAMLCTLSSSLPRPRQTVSLRC